jgi:hypothetical protein
MADLDTRSKRASSVGIALAFILSPPLPDAALSQGDRQHIAVSYSGILAGAAQPPFSYSGIPSVTAAKTLGISAAKTLILRAG